MKSKSIRKLLVLSGLVSIAGVPTTTLASCGNHPELKTMVIKIDKDTDLPPSLTIGEYIELKAYDASTFEEIKNVVFTTGSTNITIDNNVVTGIKVGTGVINCSAEGYEDATANIEVTSKDMVVKTDGGQPLPSNPKIGQSFKLIAYDGSKSISDASFTTTTPDVVGILGNEISLNGIGPACVICKAENYKDYKWEFTIVESDINIKKSTKEDLPYFIKVNDQVTLGAFDSYGNAIGDVTFSTTTPSIISINGSTITGTKEGVAEIKAASTTHGETIVSLNVDSINTFITAPIHTYRTEETWKWKESNRIVASFTNFTFTPSEEWGTHATWTESDISVSGKVFDNNKGQPFEAGWTYKVVNFKESETNDGSYTFSVFMSGEPEADFTSLNVVLNIIAKVSENESHKQTIGATSGDSLTINYVNGRLVKNKLWMPKIYSANNLFEVVLDTTDVLALVFYEGDQSGGQPDPNMLMYIYTVDSKEWVLGPRHSLIRQDRNITITIEFMDRNYQLEFEAITDIYSE